MLPVFIASRCGRSLAIDFYRIRRTYRWAVPRDPNLFRHTGPGANDRDAVVLRSRNVTVQVRVHDLAQVLGGPAIRRDWRKVRYARSSTLPRLRNWRFDRLHGRQSTLVDFH